MAYMMDSMWGGSGSYGIFPFISLGMMLFWLIIFVIIGYLVYKDANARGMNGLLWFILVIIPMIGIIALLLYVILRETATQKTGEGTRTAMEILKERYAKGEITSEQFGKMSDDIRK